MDDKAFNDSKKAKGYLVGMVAVVVTGALACVSGVPVAAVYPAILDGLVKLTGIYLGAQGLQDTLGKVFKKEEPKQ